MLDMHNSISNYRQRKGSTDVFSYVGWAGRRNFIPCVHKSSILFSQCQKTISPSILFSLISAPSLRVQGPVCWTVPSTGWDWGMVCGLLPGYQGTRQTPTGFKSKLKTRGARPRDKEQFLFLLSLNCHKLMSQMSDSQFRKDIVT